MKIEWLSKKDHSFNNAVGMLVTRKFFIHKGKIYQASGVNGWGIGGYEIAILDEDGEFVSEPVYETDFEKRVKDFLEAWE